MAGTCTSYGQTYQSPAWVHLLSCTCEPHSIYVLVVNLTIAEAINDDAYALIHISHSSTMPLSQQRLLHVKLILFSIIHCSTASGMAAVCKCFKSRGQQPYRCRSNGLHANVSKLNMYNLKTVSCNHRACSGVCYPKRGVAVWARTSLQIVCIQVVNID